MKYLTMFSFICFLLFQAATASEPELSYGGELRIGYESEYVDLDYGIVHVDDMDSLDCGADFKFS